MNLTIDIGNSSTKAALFEGDHIVAYHRFAENDYSLLAQWAEQYPIEKTILCNVVDIPSTLQAELQKLPYPLHHFSLNDTLPFIQIEYKTPGTLGKDRIAALIGAQAQAPGRTLLVIDIGSAITYDLLEEGTHYRGGNISPGAHMRLSSLHEHTGRLPLVPLEGETPPMGYDTPTAIRSGVIHSIKYEIQGYITNIIEKHPDVLIFLTGGDKKLLNNQPKNCIFADNYLLMKGLNRILVTHDPK